MREGRLARPEEPRAAAQQAGGRDGMVGGAERARFDQPTPGEHARHRVEARDLEGLLPRHDRQDRGQPAGEHRLPGPRSSDHQRVVTACRGDLQGPAGHPLSANLGEVHVHRPVDARTRGPTRHGSRSRSRCRPCRPRRSSLRATRCRARRPHRNRSARWRCRFLRGSTARTPRAGLAAPCAPAA